VRSVLGTTRFELFKSGKLSMSGMVTNGKIKHVSDLLAAVAMAGVKTALYHSSTKTHGKMGDGGIADKSGPPTELTGRGI